MTVAGPDLSGTRVLVCHSIVHDIIGSTVVTLELATCLRSMGADVLVYAAFVGDPAMSLFADADVPVVDDAGIADRTLADFDLVWINSQVLPEAMVAQLGDLEVTLPRFVFMHMSAIEYAPDEYPYLYRFEEQLSSLSLFNSDNARQVMLEYFTEPPRTDLYPNPAPAPFAAATPRASTPPTKVLVVSNHAVQEVAEARRLLEERGLEVLHLGLTGDEVRMVTPEVLEQHDVVVTIGKTVQYCLVAGVPVYVYDHFGGYGYLGEENLEHAARYNYSGRFGERRDAATLADEVVAGHAAALAFQTEHRAELVERYAIDRVVARVLTDVPVREHVRPTPTHLLALARAQSFGARFFHYWGHNANEVRNRRRLEADVEHLGRELQHVREDAERRIGALHEELDGVRASWTFRIGRAAMLPVRALRRLRGLLSR